jgi:hypothetical protein
VLYITKRYGVQSLYRLGKQYTRASLQRIYHKGDSRKQCMCWRRKMFMKFTSVKLELLWTRLLV